MKCLAKYYYLPVFLLPWPCPGSPVHAFIFWMDLNNGDKMKLGPFKELVALGLPRPHGGHHLTRLLYSWSPATVGGLWCVVETESGRGKNTEFMGCSEEWSKKLSISSHHSAWRHGSVFLLRSQITSWEDSVGPRRPESCIETLLCCIAG